MADEFVQQTNAELILCRLWYGFPAVEYGEIVDLLIKRADNAIVHSGVLDF